MRNYFNIVKKSLILLIFSVLNAFPASGDAVIEYSARIEESETVKNRLTAELDGAVLLFYDARSAWPEGETRLGIELPFFVFGPLSAAGIIRELENPLGFAPGSPVFSEAPDFLLYKGFSSSTRKGLFYRLGRRGPGFLLLLKKDAGASVGITGRLDPCTGCYADYLLCRTVLPPREAEDRWFDSRYPLPGNELLHGGIRFGYSTEEGGAALTIAYSCSPAAPGGVLLHLLFGPETPFLGLRMLGAYCSQHYRDLEGKQSRSALRLGAEGTLLPFAALTVDAAASWLLKRPEDPFDPDKESFIDFALSPELSFGDFSISLRGEHCEQYGGGTATAADSLGAELCLESRSLRISIDGEQEWEDGLPEVLCLGTRLRLSGDKLSCTLGIGAEYEEEVHLNASLLLRGSTDEGNWFINAALREPLTPEELFAPLYSVDWFKRLSLDFGWKVKGGFPEELNE